MKKIIFGTAFAAILAATFLVGYWYSKAPSSGAGLGGERTILYYVDPMNPGNRYDKPGIAPCGMALEPFYGNEGADAHSAMPPGTVTITPAKQQLIGVRIEQVAKSPSSHTIRLLGKVAADETRVYQVTSSVAGWIRRVQPFSTGSLVKKGEVLAGFYAAEFLAAEQSYIYALNSSNLRANIRTPNIQANVAEQSLPQTEDNLRFLGMGENQIRALKRTREFIDSIDIVSPVTGFVVARNISPGLRFDTGTEFYRIADLSEVWILLDTYGDEAKYFRPGEKVSVRYQGETLEAKVDEVLPQFDASTRTLKVRLVAANPEYILRPDMFVDVEHSVAMPSALTVPVDAVLDSGLKKRVFVDRGDGFFEPRRIETGKYFGDRVEISKGLMAGERIVVSGNFLIDSESRFKSSPAELAEAAEAAELAEADEATSDDSPTSLDPICGMVVNKEKAVKEGLTTVSQGRTHFFCSMECKEEFDRAPQKPAGAAESTMPAGDGKPADALHDHMHMPEHAETAEQTEMPAQMAAGEKHSEMAMPDDSPADGQMPMPAAMPGIAMEESGKMPEGGPMAEGDDPMKPAGAKEAAAMQDMPPMEGVKAND